MKLTVLIFVGVNVNYIKFTWTLSGFMHATQCSLHFDKPQKNEIHSVTVLKEIINQSD